jgi:hypothetical protein
LNNQITDLPWRSAPIQINLHQLPSSLEVLLDLLTFLGKQAMLNDFPVIAEVLQSCPLATLSGLLSHLCVRRPSHSAIVVFHTSTVNTTAHRNTSKIRHWRS